MKVSIVKKLFISVIFICILVMAVQLIFQQFFIDIAYQKTVYNKTSSELDAMNEGYLEGKIDSFDFLKNTDAVYSFFDKTGEIFDDNFLENLNYFVIDNKKIIFNDLFDERGVLRENVDISVYDEVDIKCIRINMSDYYVGTYIGVGNEEYVSEFTLGLNNNLLINNFDIKNVSGKIELISSNKSYPKSYLSAKLFIEIDNCLETDFQNELYKSRDELYNLEGEYEFIDEISGNEYMVLLKQLKNKNVYSIALYEIKELGEAIKSVSIYYYYIFAFQIVLLIMLAFIYSKLFSKPLLKLNNSARAIANENFDVKTDIKTNDELEDLSRNINAIADNLSLSLKELEDKNIILTDYANQKSEDEEKMRHLLMDLSHDFKTPLGVVSGFVELLEDDLNDKPKSYYYEVISDEIQNLNNLVENTLSLMKLEEDSLKIELIDLNELIKKVILNFEYMMKEKNLQITYEENNVCVFGDYNKLMRVFNNLISNACKYSAKNSNIIISIKEKFDEIEISIKNHPVDGLNDFDMSKLFDRYYRGELSRNREISGYGLGLSIVSKILDMHRFEYDVKIIDKEFTFNIIIR